MLLTAEATNLISDLQFTETSYRVPFQFSRTARRHLPVGAFLSSSSGITTTDLDENTFHDLTGSYGVNLFGHDFYKECIDRGIERVRTLGPVLGSYHPLVADNAARLVRLSGMDEVSFHMSGTEAVMQGSGSRATIPGAPTWCVFAARITAGGAMCSRVSAIRCRRTKHTR